MDCPTNPYAAGLQTDAPPECCFDCQEIKCICISRNKPGCNSIKQPTTAERFSEKSRALLKNKVFNEDEPCDVQPIATRDILLHYMMYR